MSNLIGSGDLEASPLASVVQSDKTCWLGGATLSARTWRLAAVQHGFAVVDDPQIPLGGEVQLPELGLLVVVGYPQRPRDFCRTLEARRVRSILVLTSSTHWSEYLVGMSRWISCVPEPSDPTLLFQALKHKWETETRWSDGAAPAVELDPVLRRLRIGSEVVRLPPRECKLLELLIERQGQWWPTGCLAERLLGEDSPARRRLLSQHIHSLRYRLGKLAERIDSSPGTGYRCLVNVRVIS